MRFIALAAIAIASALALPASAQDTPDRAGRLAYISGPVSVYQDPELGWDKAYVNTPLTSENSVWTDSGARAEVRVGGTALRLDAQTQLDISRLDDDQLDAMVASGTLEATVRYKDSRETLSISTPHARFYLQSDGRYRIDVDPQRDESRLTVFRGDARMETSRGRVRVEPGRAVVVYGGNAEYVVEAASETRFDRWTAARDDQWRDTNARRYVSSYMTGYEDLDAYGNWSQDPDYGAVWFPTAVSAGWTPYRDGRWSYVRPWGWTWVDDAPWGYAPSHYGRWVYARNRWGWAPGRRVDRPAWAPALVGWIGGSNWGVGVGSGGGAPVGWYPLSPWERYEPWYRASANQANRINVAVNNNPPRNWQGRGDDWRRWNRDHGTTVVQRDVLTERRPVQNSVVPVTNQAIREQPRMQAAQVQQALPQRNEFAHSRAGRDANVPAPIVARQPRVGGEPAAPQSQQAQQAQQGNATVRPQFGRLAAPQAPAPAPANQPPQARQAQPANPAARGEPAGQPINPAARGDENARRAREAQLQQQQQQLQQQQQQQTQQQQQQQAQERARAEAQQREAQQRDAQQQQLRARGEQQQAQERARAEAQQREAQQREAAQQQQRARDAQAQQERAARDAQAQQREAQQREAAQQQQRARDAQAQQERAARDAQAQQQAQQREAQQREAAQQQQRARDAQAQQERAARDAQVQQQRALQQQQQQQQAQERAAREAQQQAQQQAQRAQQAAREAQQQAQQQAQQAAREAQQRAAKEAQQQANPAARADKERENKDKDKEDKQQK